MRIGVLCFFLLLVSSVQSQEAFSNLTADLRTYDSTLLVLENHTSKLLVSPKFQGRILLAYHKQSTKTSNSWINFEHIMKDSIHQGGNPYGGEQRLWIGPLGGQHGLYYQRHLPISDENWFVPAPFDQRAFTVSHSGDESVSFTKSMKLSNYIGTSFEIEIGMKYILLEEENLLNEFALKANTGIVAFGYDVVSKMTNKGQDAWGQDSGMLSLWHLGNVQANENTRFIICLKAGTERDQVLQYFADFTLEELKIEDDCLIYRVKGLKRGKIGIPPELSSSKMYILDPTEKLLSVINFDVFPNGSYFNSHNRYQKSPYSGEVVAVYNSEALNEKNGFFEFETMSPSLPLKPQEFVEHKHRKVYFHSKDVDFDRLCRKVMGMDLWRKVKE